MKKVLYVVLALAMAIGLVYAGNVAYVGHPVQVALDDDIRNRGIKLSAHLGSWLRPGVLVLDLRDIEPTKAPVDLWRVVLQAAGALDDRGRSFDQVLLERRGEAVFMISGRDFSTLGWRYNLGRNPVSLLLTLPEKLRSPAGWSAYGTWSGGVLGVTTRQMEDLNDAALDWVLGK